MCNLYRLKAAKAEIAQLFGAEVPAGTNMPEEMYPGYPGLVTNGAEMRTMTWGFPLVLKGKKGQTLKPKPVTNARDDKLHTPFWQSSFERRRCLIPVTQWAEPEGEPGRMTRTWYSPPGSEPFAIAGLWRPTDTWGKCFTMVMVPSSAQMADVHDRMPVILRREDYPTWLGSSSAEAEALCRTWDGVLEVEQTIEGWGR